MGRLAQPQDLFLHLGEPLEADGHGEIAARDHHAERLAAGGTNDDIGQVLHRLCRLDLGDDAETTPIRATLRQFVLQVRDVVGGLHERVADHVGMPGDEVEVRQVGRRQRIEVEVGAREQSGRVRASS